jgi:hypothetical protein
MALSEFLVFPIKNLQKLAVEHNVCCKSYLLQTVAFGYMFRPFLRLSLEHLIYKEHANAIRIYLHVEDLYLSLLHNRILCVFLLEKSLKGVWDLQEHNRIEFLRVVCDDCMGCGNIPRTYYKRACST